jgi:flagellar L-ring protein FlgH
MKKSIIILAVIMTQALLLPACADSLWTANSSSLYTDHKACKVGDVLSVVIVESSSTKHEVQSGTSKKIVENAGGGTGILNTLNAFGITNERSSSGTGSSSQSTNLADRISVKVIEVLPNGLLRVRGERCVNLFPDKLTLTLTGLVRPNDISTENSITSTRVAELSIVSTGKGPAADTQKPGLISRLLRLIW